MSIWKNPGEREGVNRVLWFGVRIHYLKVKSLLSPFSAPRRPFQETQRGKKPFPSRSQNWLAQDLGWLKVKSWFRGIGQTSIKGLFELESA